MAYPALAESPTREIRELFRPPPRLTLSEWADRHYHMPAEYGGKWRTYPYQRAIMDALTDPEIEKVSVMKSARVGYTQILTALIAYHIAQDPCSVLIVQPTVEDAEGYSKKELAAALRENPILHGLVKDPRSRDSGNTILSKEYLGRTLWLAGANAGRGFRRIHARIAACDEIDAYPVSAGQEGDPIELAWNRTREALFGRKQFLGSTPLDKGSSRIEKAFFESDQRLYYVPCPHCDEGQPLEWGGKDKDFGIKWPPGRPGEAYYLCRRCHTVIEERAKPRMIERGQWVAHAPFDGHAGFRIWSAYSLSPNATWAECAREFVRVEKDPVRLKTWVNTWRGETWEERGQGLDAHWLEQRRENFPTREGKVVIPSSAVILTAGVDTQDDRLEVKVDAWGPGEELWTPEYHVLHGDPASPVVWKELDDVLTKPRWHDSGAELFIRGAGIDTQGHHAQAAYAYCRPRFRRRMPDGTRQFVFALKGMSSDGKKRPVWPPTASLNNIGRVRLFMVGVDAAKEAIYSRLRLQSPGPGYIHFPLLADWCTSEWFEQLTAEHAVPSYDKSRRLRKVWKLKTEGARNEALDTSVYSYATLQGLLAFGVTFEREARRLELVRGVVEHDEEPPPSAPETPRHPPSAPPPEPRPARRRRRRVIGSNWMR